MVDTQALVIPPLFEGTLGDYPTLPTVERPTASNDSFSHQKPAEFGAFHDHKLLILMPSQLRSLLEMHCSSLPQLIKTPLLLVSVLQSPIAPQ